MKNVLIPILGVVLMVIAVGGVYLNSRNVVTTPTVQNGKVEEVTTAPEMADSVATDSSAYVPYSEAAYTAAADKKRVIFFHASWCPTCKVANEDFEKNAAKISGDIVVFKTDYDTQKALKEKYGITYQHTFVQVDEQGNELTKWNGGGVEELLSKVE